MDYGAVIKALRVEMEKIDRAIVELEALNSPDGTAEKARPEVHGAGRTPGRIGAYAALLGSEEKEEIICSPPAERGSTHFVGHLNPGAGDVFLRPAAVRLRAGAAYPRRESDPHLRGDAGPHLLYPGPVHSRLLKKGIPMPETVRFRDRLNVESTSCGC